jgi:hypothetical protein
MPLSAALAMIIVFGQDMSSAASTTQSSWGGNPPQTSSDPGLALDLLEASRQIKYHAGGRNIFRMEAETAIIKVPGIPPPPATPNAIAASAQQADLPIQYYGYANKTAEPRKVFLRQHGVEQIFVAGKGDIVAHRYRVVQILQNSITMEDVITGNRQPIPLTPGERPR